MNAIEHEVTYLAKYLPEGLESCSYKDMIDIYVPESFNHPCIRFRKNGESFVITKKEAVEDGDYSKQLEQNIEISKEEFEYFSKNLKGKRLRKLRYDYDFKGVKAEIDVFQDDLKGLVLVDFEFENEDKAKSFEMPDFCFVDVTQEEFVAGGMLAGKSFEDIREELDSFKYRPLGV